MPVAGARRSVRARALVVVLVSLCASVAGMVFAGAALAAALETPETEPATSITAVSAVMHGVLNPGNKGEPGYYRFVYRLGSTGRRNSTVFSD
jgi:hypothetical protein